MQDKGRSPLFVLGIYKGSPPCWHDRGLGRALNSPDDTAASTFVNSVLAVSTGAGASAKARAGRAAAE